MCSSSLPKGPVQHQLAKLDAVFGPEYFEHGRLLFTVARDIMGTMKVAHKLQARVHECFGAVVEVIMEHIKYERWAKFHETVAMVGLTKGEEIPDCQVTQVPEGVRVHPYARDRMPTLEVLLLWEDAANTTRGHCIYSLAHPETPSLEQVDSIFEEIQPYFAMRWLIVELCLGPPVRGDLDPEEEDGDGAHGLGCDSHVGAGVDVTALACHAYGHARDQPSEGAVNVRDCQPVAFRGVSDDAGRAKLCFLPAEINKIQVAETETFHGSEVVLRKGEVQAPTGGATTIKINLTPKATAVLTVHVFEMPAVLPSAEDTDGIIDWAVEDRTELPDASVEATPMKEGAAAVELHHIGDGAFTAESGGLPEGFISLSVGCPGYEADERAVMLLQGLNEFFVPLRKI